MTNPTTHGQVPEALIYAELPKHAATGLGEEYESFDQNGKPMGKAYQNLVYYTEDQMRAFADATHALRTQQPAPAGAALSDAEIDRIVPALEPVSEDFPAEWAVWKDRERIRKELRVSHGQAPAQQETFDHGPQATSIEEAARDVGKWLNERPNRPLDLRHVAMLAHHATAPQQDAQEPVHGDDTARKQGENHD